eukprot:TRINITY_DN24005_c0_g1_i1.p1 TRINITY_DN24005_c0_g1~~TRINITY_DN24005_c0_g1_i1.p1  ORF type:complete len:386 (+),score=67.96 TRINITY_DN24005_c0_g1_i1:36-1160(+)
MAAQKAPPPVLYRKFKDFSRPQIWAVPVQAWQAFEEEGVPEKLFSESLPRASSRHRSTPLSRRVVYEPQPASELEPPLFSNFSVASERRGAPSACEVVSGVSDGQGMPPRGAGAGLAKSLARGHAVVGAVQGRSATPRSTTPARHAHAEGTSVLGRVDQPPSSPVAEPSGLSLDRVPLTSPSLVRPPWGAERANVDNPSRDLAKQRQVEYRRMLDDQNAKKADMLRKRHEEKVEWEKHTVPTLSTSTHKWEASVVDPSAKKALMKEHIAVVKQRKGKEVESRINELLSTRAWLAECDKDRVARYFQNKKKVKQEINELTSEWKRDAEEKRRQREQDRLAKLQDEIEAIREVTNGQMPHRRLRKPAESRTPRTAR